MVIVTLAACSVPTRQAHCVESADCASKRLEAISQTARRRGERAAASEPRARREPAKRRPRARVGESEGQSPSDKIRVKLGAVQFSVVTS